VKERVYDNDIRLTARGTGMTFGPSKRHEATRYVATRDEGGRRVEKTWKPHIVRATPRRESEGAGSFLPASSRSLLGFVRLVGSGGLPVFHLVITRR